MPQERLAGIILAAVGTFVFGLGLIYWLTSYESAGTVLLVAALGFAVIPGAFLWRHSRGSEPAPSGSTPQPVGEFPEASVWPFVLAAGAAIAGVGLVFGPWTALPGAILIGVGFVGGVLESS